MLREANAVIAEMVSHFIEGAVVDALARVQDYDLVEFADDFDAGLVDSSHNQFAFFCQISQTVYDIFGILWVLPCSGLVLKEKIRVSDQLAGNADSFSLAAAETANDAVPNSWVPDVVQLHQYQNTIYGLVKVLSKL